VDPKTFFSDSDPQNFFSDSDTDSDSDTNSADIYFGRNHSFNGLRTFSEYNTTKKNCVTVKICASFHLTLVFVMLYYQILVSGSESVSESESEFFFGFGFGSGKKFRILSDSDSVPQHCHKAQLLLSNSLFIKLVLCACMSSMERNIEKEK
jgi:hypothetical protein